MNFTIINGMIGHLLDYVTPILFAALGAVLTENAGVVNIGIEGIMRFGAFFALFGAYVSHTPWVGLLVGMATGAAV
ncbi:MAG: ABC transporter permease, partial [Caldisericota bacterium]|nr:ABC transporter permease [Caldisericota bacterium]